MSDDAPLFCIGAADGATVPSEMSELPVLMTGAAEDRANASTIGGVAASVGGEASFGDNKEDVKLDMADSSWALGANDAALRTGEEGIEIKFDRSARAIKQLQKSARESS